MRAGKLGQAAASMYRAPCMAGTFLLWEAYPSLSSARIIRRGHVSRNERDRERDDRKGGTERGREIISFGLDSDRGNLVR